jgi:hypothetical protein
MAHLHLVKSLSHLQEEHRFVEEVGLGSFGLSFTRGTLTEVAGGPSAGKTSLALSLLAQLTAAGEICAVVDSSNSFDPRTAVLTGVELEDILWVKCGGDLERSFMAADYLVQAKGFGAIWLNLNGLSKQKLRQVPRTYWYRYRTRIKETPTMMIVTAEEPVTGSASQQSFHFTRDRAMWSGSGKFKLLREFHIGMNSRKEIHRPVQTKIEADYTDV